MGVSTRFLFLDVDPLLIVGAGLSAADAVLTARFHSVPVLHVFRSRTIPIDRQLPEIMYPEYHKVIQKYSDTLCLVKKFLKQ